MGAPVPAPAPAPARRSGGVVRRGLALAARVARRGVVETADVLSLATVFGARWAGARGSGGARGIRDAFEAADGVGFMNVVMFALRLAFWDQEHERNELFGGPDAVKNADSKTKLTGSQFFGRFIFAMGLVTALFPVTLPMYALTGLFELYVQALDVAPSGAKVAYACLLAAPAAFPERGAGKAARTNVAFASRVAAVAILAKAAAMDGTDEDNRKEGDEVKDGPVE